MNVRMSTVLLGLFGVALAIGLWSQLGGAERRIKRQLSEVGTLIEKASGENALEGVNRARKLGGMFTDDFDIQLVPFQVTVRDRQQLMQTMARYRDGAEALEVSFSDHVLDVQEGTRQAMHAFEVAVSGRFPDGVRGERYRMRFTWLEVDGTWKIRTAELLEILEGPERFF